MHEEEAIFKGRLGGITAGSQVVNKGVKLGLMSHIFPKISLLLGSYQYLRGGGVLYRPTQHTPDEGAGAREFY
jgi:hypothetical protein